MNNEKVNELVIDTLSLSTLLVDKFEQLEKANLFIHKSKQSVKNVQVHLQNYVNTVFNFKKNNEQDELDFKNGATIVATKIEKIESILQEDVVIIGDRKEVLIGILRKYKIDEKNIVDIVKTVDVSDILKF